MNNQKSGSSIYIMDSFKLRLLAVVSMLIDHTAAVLLPAASECYTIMRSVGRLAFPIFCFLIVEGLLHTRSVPKYMARLALLAVISEIPFDLAVHGRVLEFARCQNVFLTLLLGLAAITAAHKGVPLLLKKCGVKSEALQNPLLRSLIASPAIVLCGWLAEHLSTDYGYVGVLLIWLFYVFRDNRALALAAMCIANVLCLCVHYNLAEGVGLYYRTLSMYLFKTPQLYACLSAIPLWLYNGKPGIKKYRDLFYYFYPAHLLVLGLLSLLMK